MKEAAELGNYLPLSFKSPKKQEYIAFLWDAFGTNYFHGKYQFAFLAYHILPMTFVYFNIWQIKQTEPGDFAKRLFGKDVEKNLLEATKPYCGGDQDYMGRKAHKKRSTKKSSSKAKKMRVLADHHRRGKKFIPPLMQLPGMKEVNYINQGLPELVWIGLLTSRHGFKRGVELAAGLGKIAFKYRGTDKHINFALASAYNVLDVEAKRQVVQDSEAAGILDPIRQAVAPLIVLYEGCPLAFLGLPGDDRERNALVVEIRTVVGSLFDKYKTSALVALACVMYIRSVNGGLYFPEGMAIPDCNALVDDPESEAAKRAGSFVRAFAMNDLMVTMAGRTSDWPKSFWNQGLVVDNCLLHKGWRQ